MWKGTVSAKALRNSQCKGPEVGAYCPVRVCGVLWVMMSFYLSVLEPQGGSECGKIMPLLRCSQGPSGVCGAGVGGCGAGVGRGTDFWQRLGEKRDQGGGCYFRQAQGGAVGLRCGEVSTVRICMKSEIH